LVYGATGGVVSRQTISSFSFGSQHSAFHYLAQPARRRHLHSANEYHHQRVRLRHRWQHREGRILQGSTKLGETNNNPYQWTWTNVPAGAYILTAKATDDQGATNVSSGARISVTAPALRMTHSGNQIVISWATSPVNTCWK